MSDIDDDQGGTLVVLTALPVEYQAVRAHLTNPDRQRHDHGTIFEVGWLDGTPWRVALSLVGQGNYDAAALTERAIATFKPPLVAFVGVAGGLKGDLRLGDVVVATKVYEIHGGKEENGQFHVRPVSWQMRHDLSQVAMHASMTGTGPAERRGPGVHLKPIAAGEVVLNSDEGPLRQLLRERYQDAVAIETESAGVARAAHLCNAVPTLIVRGISDPANGTKDAADAEGWQPTAAASAATFAFTVIRQYLNDLPTPERRAPAASASVAFTTSTPATPKTSTSMIARPETWRGGTDVTVGDRQYLLHDNHLQERPSPDHSLIRRQALARDVTDTSARARAARYVWLRQVEERHHTPRTRDAVAALGRERELLLAKRDTRGVPGVAGFATRGGTASLALKWPLSRATGMPCLTLDDLLGDTRDGPLDAWRLFRLLSGLVPLCRVPLAWLHRSLRSHRHITPAGLIELDDGTLHLRDLGLAVHASEPEEGPELYQAPEQRRRGATHGPGPWTDIYQLAAVTYHLVAGTPPPHDVWLPLRARVPEVPERLDRVLGQALSHDRAERPDAGAFADELDRARRDLSRWKG